MASLSGLYNSQNFTDLGAFAVGGRLYTYAPGTTTHKTAYTDAAASVSHTYTSDGSGGQYIAMNARGELPAPLFLLSGGYDITYKTSAGVTVWTRRAAGADDMATGLDTALRANLANTGTVGYGLGMVGFSHIGYAVGSGGHAMLTRGKSITELPNASVGDDATTNTASLQALLNAAVAGDRIIVPPGVYRSGALTVGVDGLELYLSPGATLRFPALGFGVSAITINANNFKLSGTGKIRGPAGGVYVGNENAITMIGTSSATRKAGLEIDGPEIYNFGAHGIYCQWVDRIYISKRTRIHDVGYGGVMCLSCNDGECHADVDNVGPGLGGDMYGIALTHDSTGYSSDPNAGTKQALHPFCRGWTVTSTVSRVAWEGIDTHGAYEISVIGAKVYATKKGISLTSSSGDAAGYSGWSNQVIGCIVDARHRDGTASGYENQDQGITLNGGTTLGHLRVVCQGNIIRYKGVFGNVNSGAIVAVRCQHANVSGNVIDMWHGSGINATAAGGLFNNNVFGAVAAAGDTTSACIRDENPGSKQLTVVGNQHDPNSGTAAAIGFKQIAGGSSRPVLGPNNWAAAGSAYSLGTSGFCLGPDVRLEIVDSSGGPTISLSPVAGQDCVVQLNAAGSYTITNFTGGHNGQTIRVVQVQAGTVTVTRANAKLVGTVNQTLGQDDTIVLTLVNGVWVQVAPVCANG